MNKTTTFGLLALLGASAFACSDDDDNNSNNGAAGSTAGTGGMGTAGTGMGTAGTGMGTAGSGMTATAPCSSCVQLDLPFTAAEQSGLYQFNNNPPVDFSVGSVTWSVQVIGGSDTTFLKPQLQNGEAQGYAGFYDAPVLALNATNFPAETWVDVTLDASSIPAVAAAAEDEGADAGPADADAGAPLAPSEDAGATDAGAVDEPPAAGGFDKSLVDAIQLQVGSSAQFTGTADVTVLIDTVTFTDVTGLETVTFDMDASGLALNNYMGSPTPPSTPEVVHNP